VRPQGEPGTDVAYRLEKGEGLNRVAVLSDQGGTPDNRKEKLPQENPENLVLQKNPPSRRGGEKRKLGRPGTCLIFGKGERANLKKNSPLLPERVREVEERNLSRTLAEKHNSTKRGDLEGCSPAARRKSLGGGKVYLSPHQRGGVWKKTRGVDQKENYPTSRIRLSRTASKKSKVIPPVREKSFKGKN